MPPGEWLVVDEAYAAQMAHKAALIARHGPAVLRLDPAARPAAEELLDRILAELPALPGFEVRPEAVICPDGRRVVPDRARPLETCARLVQEDLIVMQERPGSDEHVMTAALLAFPASWTLDEKFLKPLTAIHKPVEGYAGDMARRVQRLFDAIHPERPLWRANFLRYHDPELYQPRREADPRRPPTGGASWMRVERQCLMRLEQSRAVVFSIHTFVLPWERLPDTDQQILAGLGV